MKIALPHDTALRMKRILRRAGKREVGGILMGEQLSPGHFSIVDFSVDVTSGSRSQFTRSIENHQTALENFFSDTERNFSRFNYLGEWHSHPSFSVQPSNVDVLSMQRLVNNEHSITFSVLLIVKLKLWVTLDSSVTVFCRDAPPMSI